MLDSTHSFWLQVLFLTFWIEIALLLWGVIDTTLMISQRGTILKKGVKIAQRPLTPRVNIYLDLLQENVIEDKKVFVGKITLGFILVNRQERLVFKARERGRTAWPYIGYVNLGQPVPTLEFRASLPMHLVLLPIVMTGFGIPLVVLLMWFNYRAETQNVEQFLKQKAIKFDNYESPPQS